MKKNYFLCLVVVLMSLNFLYSQNTEDAPPTDYNNIKMAESPSAAAFYKVGETTVNAATGLPNISIPLYTYEIDGVKVPISISYNASGVKVSELATCIGLGWTLVAGGQFSRTVRGKADEFDGWLNSGALYGEPIDDNHYTEYDPNNAYKWQKDMRGSIANKHKGLAKKHDHMPDLFSYSFLGNSGSYIHKYTDSRILKGKNDGVIIEEFSPTDDDFSAYDLNGNFYEFSDAEKSNNENVYVVNGGLPGNNAFDWEQQNGNVPATAWKLSKITTKNNKTINFEYQSVPMYYKWGDQDSNITVGYSCNSKTQERVRSLGYTNTTYSYNTQLLKKISSPDGNIEVTFTYSTDNSISEDDVWKTQLESIVVQNTLNGDKKKFKFLYDRFRGDPRLKLTNLYEVGYDNNHEIDKPHYIFSYNKGSLPQKESLGQDFFGYNNGHTSNKSMVPTIDNVGWPFQDFYNRESGNRDLNINTVENGVLTDIQYPTGGTTHFEYQPNSIDGKYCGGLRVREIENIDETGTYNKKTYQYDELNGYGWPGIIRFISKDQGAATAYYSNFVSVPGDFDLYKPGFFYGKVTITSTDGNTNYREEQYFGENYNSLDRYDYALTEKIFYKDLSVPIRIEEYKNDFIGEPETFMWNILGDMMCYRKNRSTVLLGYNNEPKKVQYIGNYAYLPTRIATTDFLGTNRKPVTTLKYISYDPTTLLKIQKITDNQTTRNVTNEVVTYPVTDNKAEVLTTDYQYPWSDGIGVPDLPASLPISKVVHSTHQAGTDPISGQFFKYDTNGNIKTTFQYNKGEVSNTAGGYIPNDYEEMTSFLFNNGKPVQTMDKYGVPTSYIWAFNGEKPVAKIEGKGRVSINHQLILEIEAASYNTLPAKLQNLRNDTSVAGAMVTTYTYEPLKGVKTITDPKGDRITYFYDAFGRLLQVRDKDGKILSENEYNYAINE